jgi:HD superfamily phosphohydrolase
MALDLPRLMYILDIIEDKEGISRLAIDISGVAALEGIVFNKMMLTSAIYHHQKVRAAGCMLKNIIADCGHFSDIPDYLDYTDDAVFNLKPAKKYVERHLGMLKNRIIPKRAFCFSSRTLETEYASSQGKIMSKLEGEEFRDYIVANIVEYIKVTLKEDVDEHEIWIDSPKNPKFKEATQCLIKSEGSKDGYILLREVFPTDDWIRAFAENKWRGFVYAMPDKCRVVAEASKYVLEKVFETKFNSFATTLCKI